MLDHPLKGVSIRCVCFKSPPVLAGGGGGELSSSIFTSPGGQRPLCGSASTYLKCRLYLDAVCISCNHYWPYRVGAVLPDGHGVGPLALGHGLVPVAGGPSIF